MANRLLPVIFVLLVLVGFVIAYQNQDVTVSTVERVECMETGHLGDRHTGPDREYTTEVPRSQAKQSRIKVRQIVCPVCKERATQGSMTREASQDDERAIKIAGLAGTWIFQTAIGSCTIQLRSDGTGFLGGDEKFNWELQGANGFSGIVNYNTGFGEYVRRRIFGHVIPSGDLFTNYEPMFGRFGRTEQTIFKKVESETSLSGTSSPSPSVSPGRIPRMVYINPKTGRPDPDYHPF